MKVLKKVEIKVEAIEKALCINQTAVIPMTNIQIKIQKYPKFSMFQISLKKLKEVKEKLLIHHCNF